MKKHCRDRAKKLQEMTDKEKLWLLYRINGDMAEFLRYCLPASLVSDNQREAFTDQKIEIGAILHDVNVRISNLLLGKWTKEPELIQLRIVDKK